MLVLQSLIPSLAIVAAVGAGLMAGLLFAFSNFVMKALLQLSAASGLEAMQRINVAIINPLFLLLFIGTALVSLAILIGFIGSNQSAYRLWLIIGASCYLVGVTGITAVFNIPLNNSIANLDARSVEHLWPNYVSAWLRWNHLRCALAFAASTCFTMGIFKLTSNGAGH